MANGIQDYAALLQQLTPAPQQAVNLPPPQIAAPQGLPQVPLPQLVGGAPPVAAPQGGQGAVPPQPTKTFSEAPPASDEGMSGLDTFLKGASDSTNSGRFLMDLGMRLLQAPQQGQSQLGHIAAAGSGALNKLEAAKAAEASTASAAEVREESLTTSRRARESADVTDDLARARAEELRAKAKAKAEGRDGKLPAAAIQVRNAKIKTLRSKNPTRFPDDATAGEFVDNQEFMNKLDLQEAQALSKFRESNSILFSDDPEGLERELAGIRTQFEEVRKNRAGSPEAAAVPAAAPVTPPKGRDRASVEAGIKAGGREGVQAYLTSQGIDATPAQVKQLQDKFFPKAAKPKAKAKKAAPKRGASPATRAARAKERKEGILKSRAAGKAKQDTVKAARRAEKDEAAGYLTSTFPELSKKEMRKWFTKNRKHLTSTEVRKATRMMHKKKGL